MSHFPGRSGSLLTTWLLASVLLAVPGASPAVAQTVNMSAEPALGGFYKPNHWLPITVTLDNQGQTADVEVAAEMPEIRGGPGREYRLKVEQLPAPSRRQYTLYVLPEVVFGGSKLLDVQLIQGKQVVAQQAVDGRSLNGADRLVAVLDREQGALNMISGLRVPPQGADAAIGSPGTPSPGQPPRGQVQVAYLKPESCPDRCQGFDAVDMLVIGDVSARELSAAQQVAIRDWVATGGTLVIAGGANGMRLADPFFRDLLPVQVRGTVTFPRLVGMQRFSLRQAPATGPFVITQTTPRPGAAILATADGARLPLVVYRRSGAGQVYFTAFDYSRPPLRLWEGAPELWVKLLASARGGNPILEQIDPRTDVAWGGGYAQSRWRVGNACHEISQMDPPKFAWIGLFLVSYILVLVPANYYVLKRRDRREYAWLTTPGIVVVFSLLAYVVGFAMKGGQVLLAKVAVVEADAGSSTATAYHYLGLFSPRKTRYDVALPAAQGTLAEWRESGNNLLRPASIIESEPARAEDLAVDMWSMRILRYESALPLAQGVTAQLSRSDAGVSGTVTNHTAYDLTDCRVVLGGQSVAVGELKRGATRVIPPLTGLGAGGGRSSLQPSAIVDVGPAKTAGDRIKQAMVQPLAYSPNPVALDGPVLIGWTTQPLINVTVNGRPSRELNVGLFLIHLRS